MKQQVNPAISVVIATRNRAASVARVLAGLDAQEGAPPFEVILADNGSSDATPELARRGSTRYVLRYVRVDEPGKGRALNAALRLATGDVVAFTDDDVLPDARWLAALSDAAQHYPDATIFGGRIEVSPDLVPAWIRRSPALMGLLVSEHSGDGADPYYGFGRYPFGPNMALRRRLIAGDPAPYPEDMGPGTQLPVGDEGAFFRRVSAPEARDRVYVPAARVSHEVESGNVTFSAALRRSFAQGKSQARVQIPLTAPGARAPRPPLHRFLSERIRASGGVRAFACKCVRHAGYFYGSRSR